VDIDNFEETKGTETGLVSLSLRFAFFFGGWWWDAPTDHQLEMVEGKKQQGSCKWQTIQVSQLD